MYVGNYLLNIYKIIVISQPVLLFHNGNGHIVSGTKAVRFCYFQAFFGMCLFLDKLMHLVSDFASRSIQKLVGIDILRMCGYFENQF